MSFPPPGSDNRYGSDNSSWLDNPAPAEYVSPLTGVRESEKLGGAKPEEQPASDYAGMGTPVSSQLKPMRFDPTDFASLKKATYTTRDEVVPRTNTDYLLDVFIPVLIFALVASVIFFLLDVRYVYTSVHDMNLRFVAAFFVVGVVSLNRLIARDGHAESIFYSFFLAFMIGLYTLSTTGGYGIGSVAKNFMNSSPIAATFFNMAVVAFIWWITNRLTHECCVDENKVAGDIGILTGTARRIQEGIRRDPKAKDKKPIFVQKKPKYLSDQWLELSAYDPLDGPMNKKVETEEPEATPEPQGAGMSKRHPGISIFYFSVPVMLIFAGGLRVIQHGGAGFVLIGWFWLMIYSFSALMLLQFTSLAGLREYFRARRVQMPAGIGAFWIGLGTLMVLMVMVGAAQLPLPNLPALANVADHETDPWARGADTLQLQSMAARPVDAIRESQLMLYIGHIVMACFFLIAAYASLKGLGVLLGVMGRQRDRWPDFVVDTFDALERFLSKITRIPTFSDREKRIIIDRSVATCAKYNNSLGEEAASSAPPKKPGYHVEYAYEALCALALDLAVPRKPDQTPYEFINAFPKELSALKEDALALTRLYVMAAYSGEEVDPRVEKVLRKFWVQYNRVRARVIR